jgi:hypothetical protein
MKKITEIYKEYKIMPLLAIHQIRVAAVASMICDSLDISVEKDDIVKACILHDMGNIVKFNLNRFPKHNEPEGIEYWLKVQEEFILKYGSDDHKANLAVAREMGVSPRIYDLIDCIDSGVASAEKIVAGDDYGIKICAYVDNRVSPHGVVSVEHHSLDAKDRYKGHLHEFSEESRLSFVEKINIIENQIFTHSNIEPEDINDESVAPIIEKLKNFEL